MPFGSTIEITESVSGQLEFGYNFGKIKETTESSPRKIKLVCHHLGTGFNYHHSPYLVRPLLSFSSPGYYLAAERWPDLRPDLDVSGAAAIGHCLSGAASYLGV